MEVIGTSLWAGIILERWSAWSIVTTRRRRNPRLGCRDRIWSCSAMGTLLRRRISAQSVFLQMGGRWWRADVPFAGFDRTVWNGAAGFKLLFGHCQRRKYHKGSAVAPCHAARSLPQKKPGNPLVIWHGKKTRYFLRQLPSLLNMRNNALKTFLRFIGIRH